MPIYIDLKPDKNSDIATRECFTYLEKGVYTLNCISGDNCQSQITISRDFTDDKGHTTFKPLQSPEIVFNTNAVTKDFTSMLYITIEGLYLVNIKGTAIDLDKQFDGATIQLVREKKPKSALDKALQDLDDKLKRRKAKISC